MGNFEFESLEIPDVILVKPRIFKDERGHFVEIYKQSDFVEAGIRDAFMQDNHSRSVRGVLRGLHYQKNPAAQGKLVRCLTGAIFDVAVDIRKGSPSYGKWVGRELNDTNCQMMYVPPGFAHGFLVLSDTADVLYKCTAQYSSQHDRGIAWNDPSIGINWMIAAPVLSAKDAIHPLLAEADNNFVYAERG
jgi:dTDP-4-dehydrorhamnose 3,5-epimerase